MNNPNSAMVRQVTQGKSEDAKLGGMANSSTQLCQLATQETIQRTQDEKDRASPDYLFVWAITKEVTLSPHDRDRLSPVHLAHLAVTETIELGQEERTKIPTALLFELFVQGFVALSEQEIAGFTAKQLKQIEELGTAYSESLVSV